VGVSKQAVLHHFASKEELREAVLAELLAHWARGSRACSWRPPAATSGFQAVFGELVRFFLRRASWARLVVREALDRPGPTRLRMKREVKPWIDAVAGYIRAARPGDLRQDSSRGLGAGDAPAHALRRAAHPVLAGARLRAGRAAPRRGGQRIAHASLYEERPPGARGRTP